MALARRIYQIFTTVLVCAVILLAVLLAGVRLVGLTPYTVISGSMEPTYHVGSLLYVRDTDPMTLQEGDPVTYRMGDGQIVTHRVVEVVDDPVSGRCYRTKGDANDTIDGKLLHPANVIGRPVVTVPLLGYVSHFIQNPPGTFVAMAAVLALLALSMLTDILFPKKKEEPTPEPESDPTPTEEVDNPC